LCEGVIVGFLILNAGVLFYLPLFFEKKEKSFIQAEILGTVLTVINITSLSTNELRPKMSFESMLM